MAQDGTALWSETHPAVTLTNGQFSVELGSITPINLDFSAKYYLGIQVGSDSEMTPRRPLSSVGYAFHALKAQNSDHAQKSDHAQNSDHATGSDKANSVSDHAIRKESFALECTEGQVYRRTAAGWACETAVGPKGDKGDKGDNGDQGQQGEQGQQGFKGDKGDTGPQGPAGLTQVVTAGFAGSTGTTTQWYANTRLDSSKTYLLHGNIALQRWDETNSLGARVDVFCGFNDDDYLVVQSPKPLSGSSTTEVLAAVFNAPNIVSNVLVGWEITDAKTISFSAIRHADPYNPAHQQAVTIWCRTDVRNDTISLPNFEEIGIFLNAQPVDEVTNEGFTTN